MLSETMEKYSSVRKCVNDHISVRKSARNKKPRRSEVFQRNAVGGRKAHCVMSTAKVYAFCDEHAISARILTFLSMDQKFSSVHKLLFIHTVFIYNDVVHRVSGGAASLPGATKSWLKRVVPSAP
ncbi:hypothetical protein ROD_40591 [Citrobacter rodentium ICC168]|uniref:Uncharacterized protein n=1 Tax=Citrobacter rodentium (strain ICC168) TaxID=637910 RepID=D2THZ5_CITRI|nr:hypothetical protein ROD_40591 [Citrobacter rodentium ICC168]